MEVIKHHGMVVAGLLVYAPMQRLPEVVPKTWQRVYHKASAIDTPVDSPFVDVCLGVFESFYLQMVGMPIKRAEDMPADFMAVRIPAQRLLHHRHSGSLSSITETFAEMYAWAEQNDVGLGDFKLDVGYTRSGNEKIHDLYVGLRPDTPWHYIDPTAQARASMR